MNAAGIQRIHVPSSVVFTNAGDVQSHAVYPLAAHVSRRPPEGNDEASGSDLMSSLPVNWRITPPSPTVLTNESCFSAVVSVSGWNQCV